ncbi:MAG: glycine cleavage system protein GcvH [Alphaproteobacteria bacterium]|nr:glycine cleavage system protein GcvH [Alphaproteobacteria bacterium]
MELPQNLFYSKDHEWLKIEDNVGTIGITDFAQSELSDIVYVDVNSLGKTLDGNAIFGTIEAAKAASDLFLPVPATIEKFNENLNNHPELVNKDPYGEGWIVKVKLQVPVDTSHLLTAEQYQALTRN